MALLIGAFPTLPLLVIIWMVVRATMVFARDAGQRNVRGLGIGVSMWLTLAVARTAGAPPLLVQAIGAAGLLVSLALFEWAANSIRGRLFSYAGNDDLPRFVHRSGPYVYIRNPFYLSYLLAEIFTVVMRPSVWGGLTVVAAAMYFQWLARFEERKFARSPVAADYAGYVATTGRLLPRLPRRA